MNENYIVWTRMQAEAGQGLDRIVKRKERERRAGEDQFFWGVGNAPSVLISSLARTNAKVPIIFSRMKTKPKQMDEKPTSTVLWRQYIDSSGVVRMLPRNALVTSRGESATKRKKFHYALQCISSEPLEISSNSAPFDPAAFRNAGGTGAPVGNSQVTSLLTPIEENPPIIQHASYHIDMCAKLYGSYWVKLVDPVLLSKEAIEAIDRSDSDSDNWLDFVEDLKAGATPLKLNEGEPYLL
jgi:hypothetical protein